MAPAKKMTDAHKKPLAHGRELGRAVRDYLEYLEWSKPTRGRKRDTSPERLAEVDAQIAEADSPLQRLQLIQLRKDLEAAVETDDDPAEGERLRKPLVKAARGESATPSRHGSRGRVDHRHADSAGLWAAWVAGVVDAHDGRASWGRQ